MLDAMLAPISVRTFLYEYFGLRPLLVRGHPGKFDKLLKPGDFIYGLDKVAEIRCVFKDLKQATISPADVREMYEAGATICVTGVDRAHSSLQAAAKRIERDIGYAGRIDFRAYLSPPKSGFDIHYDARVATTLQIDGTKTWWYSDEPHVPFPTENSPRSDMRRVRRAVSRLRLRKVILQPGDLLCLPPGVWHKAQAGSGGSLALNMAFNHAGATVLDLILSELRDALGSKPGCREPFFAGPPDARSASIESHIQTCRDEITNALGLEGCIASLRHLAASSRRRKQSR
jgi:ribosomal protein L16 Arg81 hydroxylase